jgi:hypothetical protein
MKTIKHKTFTQPTLNHEWLRGQVEAFINEIGAENVLSITESRPLLSSFCIVVWFFADKQ